MIKLAPGASIAVDHTGKVTARTASGAFDVRMTSALTKVAPTSAAKPWAMAPRNATRAAQLGVDRWIRLGVPAGTDTPALVSAVMRAAVGGATVQWAEIDAIGTLADVEAPVPDDFAFGDQWGMDNTGQVVNGVAGTSGSDINARGAWHVTVGSPSAIIAVLDSGVNHHDDFGDRVLPGWNVPQMSTSTDDGCSNHGTHVSGVLAAEGNNEIAVAGLSWNAKILPVVVVNPCSGQSSWLADGLYWATDHGATVANMSLQYSVGTQYLYDAVLYAKGAGVPLIAAAGNTGLAGVAWPAKWDEVIAVGSLDSSDVASPTSAVGPEVDVAAPGVNVLSTIGWTEVGTKNGTSMACPHVAGTIALMQQMAPQLSIAQLRGLLESHCVDVQAVGVDNTSGHGRIDASASVRAVRALVGEGDLNGDGFIDGADLGQLLGSWGGCGTPCPADLNDDNTVDGADLGTLLGNWTIPE